MRVTLDIPDSYAMYFKRRDIEKDMKLYTALILVKQGKVSLSKGAELAGITIYDFLKECRENEIPVIDYSKEKLAEEFDGIKREFV
ncbi:MAG: UPF0175 family protein [Candidatus Aminicenantes bacterium]|nr:UPF0175 family protein [Candidatus Aminicenantes bacterium]